MLAIARMEKTGCRYLDIALVKEFMRRVDVFLQEHEQ